MSSELPPTDYFTGISFNPDFYQSTSSDYLTASTGKSYFLSYPTAQGTETITTLKSSSIDSSSTTTNMAIASAQTSGALNIASLPSRTGNINIGYSTSTPSGLGYNINMGNILSNTSIGGKYIELAAASSGITLSTSGTLDMITNTINIGQTSSTTNIPGVLVGKDGCLAGRTNYVSYNTSTLPATLSTLINMNLFVYLFGSTALKVLTIPVVSTTGQVITIKNGASVDVSLSFTNVMLFDSTSLVSAVILQTKGVISIYWGGAFWIQTGPSNTMSELTINGTLSVNDNLSMGSNKTIFTTSGQQLRLGYANTQTTGLATSSFGPFVKSFGPTTIPGTAYDILYDGTDGLFPTGTDGCGGLLTVFIKNTIAGAKVATYAYGMTKRVGLTAYASLSAFSLTASGWVTSPVVSAGTGNNIRITFNSADVSGTQVSWTLIGFI